MKFSRIINAAAVCLLFLAGSAVNAKDVRSKTAEGKYWDFQYAQEQKGVLPGGPPPGYESAPPSGAYEDRYRSAPPPPRDYYEPRSSAPPPPPPRAAAPARVSAGSCISGFRTVGDARGNFRCESETPRCPAGMGFQAVASADSGVPQRLQYRCFRPEG